MDGLVLVRSLRRHLRGLPFSSSRHAMRWRIAFPD